LGKKYHMAKIPIPKSKGLNISAEVRNYLSFNMEAVLRQDRNIKGCAK
jgi:hypothetical protein